ncbi:MAG TPA: hypothetical protein VNO70_14975 [Blastocatellia bacterium]|nr:hypothetical protein [Blastocatellia bacterium]
MRDQESASPFKLFLPAILSLMLAAIAAGGQIQLDRPKTEKPLPNPSILPAARDEVMKLTRQMLETREIPLDKENCDATTGECTLVSKQVVFIKGIEARSQLQHYCEVPVASVRNWRQGRYLLRIKIAPASPTTSQVGVYAEFAGLADNITSSEWVALTSKGVLEDRMLRCIQDRVQGGDCEDIFNK